jgi:hypothetical protein
MANEKIHYMLVYGKTSNRGSLYRWMKKAWNDTLVYTYVAQVFGTGERVPGTARVHPKNFQGTVYIYIYILKF